MDQNEIQTTRIMELCEIVAAASKRPIPDNKPVTGKTVFLHESGIHCRALLNNRHTYEPFSAEIVGRTAPEFMIGKHSGTATIKHILEKQGYIIDQSLAVILLQKLREFSNQKKGSCSIDDLMMLYEKVISHEQSGTLLNLGGKIKN